MKKKVSKKESEFDKLARLIKSESEDIRGEMKEEFADVRSEMKSEFANVRKEMREGFSAIIRRLDTVIQMQLDEHARRIKELETAVFHR
ncbi:MAG: hypothetical protein UY63_C0010G0022 [Parcubacteria group bacterium GW2011_GWA2_51_10]|nr:MAG: hypothetical protein UY63_C0010G0022 [Parcubacteria group bacterium GW2011_GWA2_51_10]